MDNKTIELAKAIHSERQSKTELPPKFKERLPEDKSELEAVLLSNFMLSVEQRGRRFILDENVTSKIEKVVRWIYTSPKRGLLLCGTLGNGKTTMLRAIHKTFGSSEFFESKKVFQHFAEKKSFPEMPRVLLLDELGEEPDNLPDHGTIYRPLTEMLLNQYTANRPTIITTNLTFDQIGERYGERLHDRMKEMFNVIKYIEPSYRN